MRREESDILEFKLRVDSQRKIAKTLVAFAHPTRWQRRPVFWQSWWAFATQVPWPDAA